MKSSLRRLRGFALYKPGHKQRREEGLVAHQEELLQATEDIRDIRNCYDSLLSAAAATANSAYEFSEALREYGTCLLDKTAIKDEEENGRVLFILGKAQFELQKFVDIYRVHVIQTITTPSESLLKELQTVEEMKRQCDDKRDLYKFMLTAQREKGRLKHAKGESFSPQQLRAAQQDYEEEATLFLFRLKSLKQGQLRSLLTQAARHHASQLNFFRKGVKSLEGVEPHIKVVAEQQHIDFQFIGLEDDRLEEYGNAEYDDFDDDDDDDDGELSFNYGRHDRHHDVGSFSRSSMEENTDGGQADFSPFRRDPRTAVSMSAPLFSNKKSKPSERIRQMQPSPTKRFYTYALPTPLDVKSSTSTGSGNSVCGARVESKGGCPTELWHSSPLQPNMLGKDCRDVELPSPTSLATEHAVLKESNMISSPITIPSASEGMLSKLNQANVFHPKVNERQAFSGPLTSKPQSSKPALFATNSMILREPLSGIPAKPTSIPTPKLSLPSKASPSASPPSATSPRINELHELPRPPIDYQKHRPSSLIGHSAPLVSRGQEHSATNKRASICSQTATPLPKPPGVMTRSFSIPSSGQRCVGVANSLDHPHSQKTTADASFPQTPLMNRR
ncbi:hypothetical protein Cni_G26762 [Canna indica]|uniref:BAR domain-containing protein n=1 Tax=Canna indica TaxID=4628 RepID=A0AAQ3QNN6_9LILI|nr:hypothetical protein Cni_G26762 [Canna indica]